VFGSHEKNYEMQKSEFGKCRWNPATSGRRCRIPEKKFDRIPAGSIAESGHIRLDLGHFGQIRPNQWPDPVISGRFGQIRLDL
jgi:hypothetical protein